MSILTKWMIFSRWFSTSSATQIQILKLDLALTWMCAVLTLLIQWTLINTLIEDYYNSFGREREIQWEIIKKKNGLFPVQAHGTHINEIFSHLNAFPTAINFLLIRRKPTTVCVCVCRLRLFTECDLMGWKTLSFGFSVTISVDWKFCARFIR